MEISELQEAETSQKILLTLSSLSIAKASIALRTPGLEPLLGLHVAIVSHPSTPSPELMWPWDAYGSAAPGYSQATTSRIRKPFPKGANIYKNRKGKQA